MAGSKHLDIKDLMEERPKSRALYPGVFDPFNEMHNSIVSNAIKIFDEIYICVFDNYSNESLIDMKKREEIVKKSVSSIKEKDRIFVISTRDNILNIIKHNQINVIIKHIFDNNDFEKKSISEKYVKEIYKNINFLYNRVEYKFIDFRTNHIRGLIKNKRYDDLKPYLGNDITKYVENNYGSLFSTSEAYNKITEKLSSLISTGDISKELKKYGIKINDIYEKINVKDIEIVFSHIINQISTFNGNSISISCGNDKIVINDSKKGVIREISQAELVALLIYFNSPNLRKHLIKI